RDAFCSLVGSKYAAVVAGGQGAEWLITNCKAIVKVHREISDEDRRAITAALDDCSDANQRRNVLVHGVKAVGRRTDGSFHTLRSRKGTHIQVRKPWTTTETEEAAAAIRDAAASLYDAMYDAIEKASSEEMAAAPVGLWLDEDDAGN